jgi:hypothetical protein
MKFQFFFGIVLASILTACGGGGGGPSLDTGLPTLQSVKISTSASTIYVGDTVTLTAEGIYSDGTTRSVVVWGWTSSNTQVATLSSTMLSAKGAGETTVTAEVSSPLGANLKGSLQVKILPAIAKSVRISGFSGSTFSPKTTYSTNDERQLALSVIYTDSTREPTLPTTWTSSNPGVLTVGSTGYLEAVAPGDATITAQNGDFSTSQKISIVSPDATPTVVVYCNQGSQAPISAASWNAKVAADATNSKEWITVDYASCSGNAVVKLLYQDTPGSSTFYSLMEARRNTVAGKFEAPFTYGSKIAAGKILTVGNSTTVSDFYFTKIFDISAGN